MKDWVAYKQQKFISQFWKREAQKQVASMVNEGFFSGSWILIFPPHGGRDEGSLSGLFNKGTNTLYLTIPKAPISQYYHNGHLDVNKWSLRGTQTFSL